MDLEENSGDLVKSIEEIDAEVRSRNCLIDIQKILKRWNCGINPIVNISGAQGMTCGFSIVAMKNTVGV